ARHDALFVPYHHAIAMELDRLSAACEAPALISIHSFTPVFDGQVRPWQLGVLWDYDPRMAVPLMEALAADPALTVGDNLPYSARNETGYTAATHAQPAGRPHVMIEVRQDLLSDPAGVAHWAHVLLGALRPILADGTLYKRQMHRRTPAWQPDHMA
ncbi:MAG: N-formylglutamate amidohydrolase, partial [Alphaproteobacteria bacterium]